MTDNALSVQVSPDEIESLHDRADAAESQLISLLVSLENEAPSISLDYRDEILDALEHVRSIRSRLAQIMLSTLAKPQS